MKNGKGLDLIVIILGLLWLPIAICIECAKPQNKN